MPRFKIKDLSIELPTGQETAVAAAFPCNFCTVCTSPYTFGGCRGCSLRLTDYCGCTQGYSYCGWCTGASNPCNGCTSPTCGTTWGCTLITCEGFSKLPTFAGADLGELKAELQARLKEIEQQEAAEGALPDSPEAAAELESRLQEALDEVRAHRARLAQQHPPQGGQPQGQPQGGGGKPPKQGK